MREKRQSIKSIYPYMQIRVSITGFLYIKGTFSAYTPTDPFVVLLFNSLQEKDGKIHRVCSSLDTLERVRCCFNDTCTRIGVVHWDAWFNCPNYVI